jgi:hypothetical protein
MGHSTCPFELKGLTMTANDLRRVAAAAIKLRRSNLWSGEDELGVVEITPGDLEELAAKLDELERLKEVNSNAAWAEEYRRGMSW